MHGTYIYMHSTPRAYHPSKLIGMALLAQQLSALKGLVDAAPSSSVRDQLLGSHAESIKAQILNKPVTEEEVKSLTAVIQGMQFSADQKSELLVALSTSLLRANKGASGSGKSQVMVDLVPYLTGKEWDMIHDGALGLKVKLRKLSDVLMKLGCLYPGEPSKGHVVSLLKQCGHDELSDPQTFNLNLKLVKNYITEARKKAKVDDSGRVHIDVYNGNPKDLPKDIYQKAYAEEGPCGRQEGLKAHSVGPLRGSHKDMRPQAISSAANTCQMTQLASFASMMASFVRGDGQHANQQTAAVQAPVHVPAPAPTVQAPAQPSVSTTAVVAAEPQANETVNVPPPISPAKQAKAMAAAWGQDPAEEDEDLPHRGRGRGRGRGRRGRGGRGSGRGRGRGRGAMKKPAAIAMKRPAAAMPVAETAPKVLKRPSTHLGDNGRSRGKDITGLSWGERMKQRPNGCSGCRWTPGCCPSCWRKGR